MTLMEGGQEPTDVESQLEEMQGEVTSVGKAAREAAQEQERTLQDRLASIERRGNAAIEKRMAEERKIEAGSFSSGGLGKSTGIGLSVAYALLGLPLVGYGLGWLVDRGTQSNVFQLVGFCVGGAAGIWFSVHQMKRM